MSLTFVFALTVAPLQHTRNVLHQNHSTRPAPDTERSGLYDRVPPATCLLLNTLVSYGETSPIPFQRTCDTSRKHYSPDNSGDLLAAGALDVHEERVWSRNETLELAPLALLDRIGMQQIESERHLLAN